MKRYGAESRYRAALNYTEWVVGVDVRLSSAGNLKAFQRNSR